MGGLRKSGALARHRGKSRSDDPSGAKARIFPVTGRKDWACLDSTATQQVTDFEAILVDD